MNKVYKVFPGGKFKVLTFSYDDGKIEDRRLVKLLILKQPLTLIQVLLTLP